MSRIKRDNADIEYRITGNGETTLLFVHGSYMDQGCWDEQVGYFRPDYRVVTLDLPGHGMSGKDRDSWSVQGFAEDVAAVINLLKSDDLILIGHSLGADVNLIAATLHPESVTGFIAIDNFKNAATPLPERYQEQAIAERVVKAYRGGYRPMGLATMPEIFELYRLEKELLPRLRPKLHLINVDYIPTDEEPLRWYARNGYEVTRIPGTSHYPMLENPAVLNAALGRVIRKIRKDSAVPV